MLFYRQSSQRRAKVTRGALLFLLCMVGEACTRKAVTGSSNSGSSTSSVVAQPPASSSAPAAVVSGTVVTPSATVAPTLGPELRRAQSAALLARFPHARVQSSATAETNSGSETLALVWEDPPVVETRCPPEQTWSAFDIQSCSGFKGTLAGIADVVRFRGDELSEILSLRQFFQTDDNPSGVEIDGHRGAHAAFISKDDGLELHDVDGDGHATEWLLHVGNGPYAIIEYWAAIGIVAGHLGTPRGPDRRPLVATKAAWLDLEKTGRGTSQLYCGARCGNTASRWVLERPRRGTIVQHEFWTCTPDVAASWRPGPPNGSCDQ